MLPKKNRADKKAVERIFKEGKVLSSSGFTFRFILLGDSSVPRISFIVPKTISKKAVNRNLLRRRGYSVLGKYINKFPPLLGVLVFKRYPEDISKIEDEIKNIRNKIN